MGESETAASSTGNSNEQKANGHPNLMAEALHSFTQYFPKNVGKYLKVGCSLSSITLEERKFSVRFECLHVVLFAAVRSQTIEE